jgi:hypothetical protein
MLLSGFDCASIPLRVVFVQLAFSCSATALAIE